MASSEAKIGWIFGAIALTISILSVAVGATWTVGSVKATTGELRVEITSLGRAVEKLSIVLKEVDDEGNSRQERLGVLEERLDTLQQQLADIRVLIAKIQDR